MVGEGLEPIAQAVGGGLAGGSGVETVGQQQEQGQRDDDADGDGGAIDEPSMARA
ncbi:MAG: hypothetical protein ACHQ7M_09990 [Chloroflexota bacterium]